MKEGIEAGGGVEAGDPKVDGFVGRVRYHQMNFDDGAGDKAMKAELEKLDAESGTLGNRLFYLATAPDYFSDIIKYSGRAQEGASAGDGGGRRRRGALVGACDYREAVRA